MPSGASLPRGSMYSGSPSNIPTTNFRESPENSPKGAACFTKAIQSPPKSDVKTASGAEATSLLIWSTYWPAPSLGNDDDVSVTPGFNSLSRFQKPSQAL